MNPNNDSELCIGMYKCTMTNKILLLAFKILYILLWGWFLNLLCKNGLKKLSWFILLIPFLVVSIGIGALMLTNKKENFKANGAASGSQQHGRAADVAHSGKDYGGFTFAFSGYADAGIIPRLDSPEFLGQCRARPASPAAPPPPPPERPAQATACSCTRR